MSARPQATEAAPYYFNYIDKVIGDDVIATLENQLPEYAAFFSGISEQTSLHRYAPDKWSIREVLSHLNDAERVFSFRAFWFARGFDTAMPSFDQNIAVTNAAADQIAWATHVEEFRRVRLATVSLFRNLQPEAWTRSGIASDNRFTVRALAYTIAGHLTHHGNIIRERYL